MSQSLIRHLRLYCASPNIKPVRDHDGVLAVAGVFERAGLARLLLVDTERWGRNQGASVTNAVGQLVPAAHRHLIGGFGIPIAETLIVELDASGAFDRVCDRNDGMGMRHEPLHVPGCAARPRSREAFLAVAGDMGRAMLQRAEAIGSGEWVGVEG